MKNLAFIIFALVLASGCATARRPFVPNSTTPRGQVTYQRATVQPQGMYQQGLAPQVAPGGYGGMQIPPAMFVSEYAGSTYDPRTHGAVVQTDMMREQARRSGAVTAPALPSTGCANCASQDDLDVVMDQVDRQGRAVHALRREVRRRR